MVKSRFCPSPTGFIHLGNARTALFSYLFAQRHDGIFLLRIEDTDVARSEARYDQALQHDLKWLGLLWQEGPGVEGATGGPYYQSQRQNIYDDYYQRLEIAHQAYPCFCSEEQLALARKLQRAAGKPPRYAGTCRALSEADIAQKREQGLKPTLRFRVPEQESVIFVDAVRGQQVFQTNDLGDFIIRRADGTAPFLFCNAIDDALMQVTHVLRGEDHLANTPRQILLLHAFGLAIPTYAHITLIVGSDNRPLSKREGSRSLQELRSLGYLPIAVNNYLARLGHYYKDNTLMSLDELGKQFSLTGLSQSAAQFNQQQLDYWQKYAVSNLSEADFWQWIGSAIPSFVSESRQRLFTKTIQPNILFPKEVEQWVAICFGELPPWTEEQMAVIKTAGAVYFDTAIQACQALTPEGDRHSIVSALEHGLKLKGKSLHQPLRVALTAQLHGPELAPLLAVMTTETIERRLQTAKRESVA